MRRRLLPRSIRGRLLVTVVLAVAVSLVAMIAGFNVLLQHNLSHGADQLARARAEKSRGEVQVVPTAQPADLVARLLSKDRQQRPPMREVVDALRTMAGQLPSLPRKPPRSPRP